ncbi:MAG: shikimate dehydrogenase [Candidatus Brocadiia bacterium]
MTTSESSIMRVFPAWAEHLGLDAVIKGVDCRWHDDPQVYRHVVAFLKGDPLSLGALVTTHKMDLLNACRDLFDELGRHADLLGEVSCISKRNGSLRGHAKDPITSGLALEAFVPREHWRHSGGEVCILGAGGSSLALTTYLMTIAPEDCRPAAIRVTNRSKPRLEHMRQVHAQINPGLEVSYRHCPAPEQNDDVVNALPPGSLVANATGLGKDAPGSPLTAAARFPEGGYAWDFNYRGDLLFLDQARSQQAERDLHLEDGWVYFIHGWTRVIAEVFDVDIPTSGPQFEEISRIAAEARK